MLLLRREEAELLGYRDYAEVSLARKMAGSAGEVRGFPQGPDAISALIHPDDRSIRCDAVRKALAEGRDVCAF